MPPRKSTLGKRRRTLRLPSPLEIPCSSAKRGLGKRSRETCFSRRLSPLLNSTRKDEDTGLKRLKLTKRNLFPTESRNGTTGHVRMTTQFSIPDPPALIMSATTQRFRKVTEQKENIVPQHESNPMLKKIPDPPVLLTSSPKRPVRSSLVPVFNRKKLTEQKTGPAMYKFSDPPTLLNLPLKEPSKPSHVPVYSEKKQESVNVTSCSTAAAQTSTTMQTVGEEANSLATCQKAMICKEIQSQTDLIRMEMQSQTETIRKEIQSQTETMHKVIQSQTETICKEMQSQTEMICVEIRRMAELFSEKQETPYRRSRRVTLKSKSCPSAKGLSVYRDLQSSFEFLKTPRTASRPVLSQVVRDQLQLLYEAP